MARLEQLSLIVPEVIAKKPWIPSAYPYMQWSENFNAGFRSHAGLNVPYCDVELIVADGSYQGPIVRATSTAVDSGGGGHAYALDSFLFYDHLGQEVISTHRWGGSTRVFVADKSLTPLVVADAVQAACVAVGGGWHKSSIRSDFGYTVRAELYQPLREEQMRRKPHILLTDQQGKPLHSSDGRAWCIDAEIIYT